MLLSEAAAYISRNIPPADVMALYGYHPDRNGFMPCPFHSETRGSLKVYPDHWYCYGCHAGGSALDFVMRHESCSFSEAVRAVDRHLSLNLLAVESWDEQMAYRSVQRTLDRAETPLLEGADALECLISRRVDAKFREWLELERIPVREKTADDWTRLLVLRDELAELDCRLEKNEKFRKEVRRWRNSQRMTKKWSSPGRSGPL